jgi:type I restriction enzyme, S subunit
MSECVETEIGNIPKSWKVLSLDELKSEKKSAIAMGPFGSNITRDNFIPQGVPVIRGNNLNAYKFHDKDFVFVSEEKANELKSSECIHGDLIITHRGTIGQVGIIPKISNFPRYIVSQSGLKVSVNPEKAESEFVFYYLKSRVGQYHLLRNASQVGVPAIAQPTSSIKDIPVPVPPLNERKQIVSALSSVDSKIDLLRRENQTLESIAQTLFKRWFIDFEFPNKDGKPYKSSGGKMVESELGEMPDGWKVGVIKDIGTIITGKTPSSNNPEHFGDFIPFVTPTDFRNYGKFILNSVRGISKKGKQSYEKYIIPEASIIVTCIGSDMGKVAITATPCITNQQINTIVFNSDFAGIEYLYQHLKNIYHLLRNIALGGSTMPIINKSAFENIDIILPDNKIIKSFESITKVFSNKMIKNEETTQTLTNTRDILLPKLMSGQIRVKSL